MQVSISGRLAFESAASGARDDGNTGPRMVPPIAERMAGPGSAHRTHFRRPLIIASGDGFGAPQGPVEFDVQFGEPAIGLSAQHFKMLRPSLWFPDDLEVRIASLAPAFGRP